MVKPFPIDKLERLPRAQLNLGRQLRALLGGAKREALGHWARGIMRASGARIGPPIPLALPTVASRLRAATRLRLLGPNGREALLALDRKLASAISCALLGIGATPALARTSAAERGLIVYAIASLLQELGPQVPWSVVLPEPPLALAPHSLVIETTVDFDGQAGLAWLVLDSAQLLQHAGRTAARPVGRIAPLVVSLPLVAGRITLDAASVRGLRPRDIIVSNDCPAPDWTSARLEVSRAFFNVNRDDRHAKLASPLVDGAIDMPELEPPATQDFDRTERRSIADRLPIQIAVEVARVELTGAQVMDLAEGDVLPLDLPISAHVDLRVGGRLLARGELVDVEGEAGVRLLELAE